MFFRVLFSLFISLSIFFAGPKEALACESCLVPRIGRMESSEHISELKKWFFDLTLEQQNWNTSTAREAHDLHHDGHHVHNKTHEEFYHFTLGANPIERVTLYAEMPLVVKGSIEVDSHQNLGKKEESKGLGDAHLIGTYRFYEKDETFLGAVLGVKLPSGETKRTNSRNEFFEMELQPGSGSYDFPIGATYQWMVNPFVLRGNVMYVFKNKGARQFEYGDLFSTSVFVDFIVGPKNENEETKIGMDINFQHEERQEENGQEIADSGGDTLLIGPALSVRRGKYFTWYTNILFPVYQNLGGVHQELDYVWHLGAKANW